MKNKQHQKFWSMEKTTEETVEIKIYGEIGEGWWGESTSASEFARELNIVAKDAKEIIVGINSPGGDVFEGLAIRSTLVNHPAKVIVRVEGWAASIASVIAMAGNEIEMALGSMMMVHNPWSHGAGEAKDLRELADTLDQLRDSLIDVYENKTKINRDEIAQLLDEETWMSAHEAVEKGFADRVEVDYTANVSASANGNVVVNGVRMPRFKNAPTPSPSPSPTNKKAKEGEKRMKTVEDFKNQYPDLYAQVVAEGQQKERERIKNIEDIAMSGYEELAYQAKFEQPEMSAEKLAVQIVMQDKKHAQQHMQKRQEDARSLQSVVSNEAPTNNEGNGTSMMASIMSKMRGGE